MADNKSLHVNHRTPPDYVAIEQELWRRAHQKVRTEAKDRDKRLMKRLESFVRCFGFAEREVLDKIQNDDMFAACFAKNPTRTAFHEKVAADWIEALPGVNDFKVLPKAGKKSLKVSSDGNIESETDGKKLPGKSLDFSWKTGDKTFYAMHKYTAESGGSQDQQFGEMLELMKRFTSCQNQDVVLLIIVDGEYYQKNDQERLEKLRHLQRGKLPRSFALSINEIPHLISQYTE